nr:1-deoxy-D-xylulose-5-phosphate synthase N-terminal domain-containing protein [Veillonella denticariosi]
MRARNRSRPQSNKGKHHRAHRGDGALSGGEAFEALNHLATLRSNCIVIINDNDRSIAENHGGLYTHLKELRDTNGACTNNMFKALGFDYRYIEEGNSVLSLIAEFKSVINYPRPHHLAYPHDERVRL